MLSSLSSPEFSRCPNQLDQSKPDDDDVRRPQRRATRREGGLGRPRALDRDGRIAIGDGSVASSGHPGRRRRLLLHPRPSRLGRHTSRGPRHPPPLVLCYHAYERAEEPDLETYELGGLGFCEGKGRKDKLSHFFPASPLSTSSKKNPSQACSPAAASSPSGTS